MARLNTSYHAVRLEMLIKMMMVMMDLPLTVKMSLMMRTTYM